jgi:hypothetical protein
MRIYLDLPNRQLEQLAMICAARRLSRAEAVLQAVAAFIEQHRSWRESAFGLWKDKIVTLPGETEPLHEDGLAFQEKLRGEWNDRFNESSVKS